jgi:beta-1,4-mannosyltransferase
MTIHVAFFPKFSELSLNPYWIILKNSLEKNGVTFETPPHSTFGRSWLITNRNKINVLHLHYIQQFYVYKGQHARFDWVLRFGIYLILARLTGYRVIFTMHNLKPTYPLKPYWLDYVAHWLVINVSNSVIVHCDLARLLLTKKYGRKKNIYCVNHPNFINTYPNTIKSVEAREKLGLMPDHLIYLFVGGIRPNKGIDSLIRAFKQLSDNHLRLIIAGKIWPPEEYTQTLLQYAEEDDRIKFFLGYIPDEKLQIYLNSADVVVLPFSEILTSGSTILSMSYGKPVIVPKIGCLPELVNDNFGWLYDPEDPESLLLTLQKPLQADLTCMGKAAQKFIKDYSEEKFASETLKAYQLQ